MMKIIVIALLMLCLVCPMSIADTSSVFYEGDILHVVITDDGSTYYLEGNTGVKDTCTKLQYDAAVLAYEYPKTFEERIAELEGKVVNLEKVG